MCIRRFLIECDGLRWLEITLIRRDKGCGQMEILWSSSPFVPGVSSLLAEKATLEGQRKPDKWAHIQGLRVDTQVNIKLNGAHVIALTLYNPD